MKEKYHCPTCEKVNLPTECPLIIKEIKIINNKKILYKIEKASFICNNCKTKWKEINNIGFEAL